MDNSHLLDIIRIIYNMQEKITNNNCNLDTCTRPILGPAESLYNTRPFNLYLIILYLKYKEKLLQLVLLELKK